MSSISFRTQITLVFGGLAVVFSAGLSVVVGSFVYDGIVAEQANSLRGAAAHAGGLIGEGLRERLREIELLAASLDVDSDADERFGKTLARLQRSQPAYAWIGVTDAQGVVRHESQPLLAGRQLADRRWFVAARGGPHVGDVHPAELLMDALPPSRDGLPPRFLDFAVPLTNDDGGFTGVLAAHVHWSWAADVIEQVRSQQRDRDELSLYIVDRQGASIHRPSEADARLAVDVPRPSVAGVVDWSDGRFLTVAMKVEPRSAASDLGWTIVARRPEARALAAARRTRIAIVAGGALLGLLATVLVWLIAVPFTQPLRLLSAAARRLEAGDLAQPIPPVHGSREIRGLSSALRAVKRRLQVAQRAVRRAYSTVETRVRERTAALATDNAVLRKLAERDALTGLHNRRAADSRLAEEIARHGRSGRPLSVLLIDIDHFKQVNDRHGHAVGDLALRCVGDALCHHLRSTDFVARFGGEEFLVLLPETAGTLALRTAEKLRAAVAALEAPEVGRVTVSIGMAELPVGASLKAAQLLHAADLALYEAKACGRDRVVAFDTLRRSAG